MVENDALDPDLEPATLPQHEGLLLSRTRVLVLVLMFVGLESEGTNIPLPYPVHPYPSPQYLACLFLSFSFFFSGVEWEGAPWVKPSAPLGVVQVVDGAWGFQERKTQQLEFLTNDLWLQVCGENKFGS